MKMLKFFLLVLVLLMLVGQQEAQAGTANKVWRSTDIKANAGKGKIKASLVRAKINRGALKGPKRAKQKLRSMAGRPGKKTKIIKLRTMNNAKKRSTFKAAKAAASA